MRSYTIDYDCSLPRALFTDEEWTELCAEWAFEMPEICETTTRYLAKLHKALNQDQHPAAVAIPNDDAIACELALISVIQW